MSLFGAFLKAAALGAVANAFLPTRCVQCAPLLDASQTPLAEATTATQDFRASICLQDGDAHWSVEADDFQNGLRAATAQLRILRLGDEYVDAEGNSAPVMRLVGLFPGVSTDVLHRHLTDLRLRLAWDTNYTFFERFPGEFCGTLQGSLLQRPLAAVAKKRRHCEGDVCTLVPDISSSTFDHGWFCHGVGSSSLRRFGLVDRLFQYERLSHAFHFTADTDVTPATAATTLTMYDILFSGSKTAREAAGAASPPLAAWLKARRSRGDCEGVDVNFQHILLLPIADANAQILERPEQLQRLCTMGSVLDVQTAKLVYSVFKDSQERTNNGQASLPASLLVMTSANNVSVPVFLPLWMQKKISGSVSRKAYGNLMAACLKEQGQ